MDDASGSSGIARPRLDRSARAIIAGLAAALCVAFVVPVIAGAVGGNSQVGGCSSVGGNSSVGGGSPVGNESDVCGSVRPDVPKITNLPSNAKTGTSFNAFVKTNGDGEKTVSSNTTGICTASGLAVTLHKVGVCSLTAHVATGAVYLGLSGTAQKFNVGRGTASKPVLSNIPSTATFGTSFTATVSTTGDGKTSLLSSTPRVCTTSGLKVSAVGVGTCSIKAHVASSTNYLASTGAASTFAVLRATPSTPRFKDLPAKATVGKQDTLKITTTGDGALSLSSSTLGVCTTSGLTVRFVGVGACVVTPHVAQGPDFLAADGTGQTISVAAGTSSKPIITNLPTKASVGGSFLAVIQTTGDGQRQVTSNTPLVCTVTDLVTVAFLKAGTCSLTASVGAGTNYTSAVGSAQSFLIKKATKAP